MVNIDKTSGLTTNKNRIRGGIVIFITFLLGILIFIYVDKPLGIGLFVAGLLSVLFFILYLTKIKRGEYQAAQKLSDRWDLLLGVPLVIIGLLLIVFRFDYNLDFILGLIFFCNGAGMVWKHVFKKTA